MESKTNSQVTVVGTVGRVYTAEGFFVLAVWFIMLVVALVCISKYGGRVPLWEDWFLVAPLTGNEPDLGKWLWAQNAEHRIPVPRSILLGLLKLTNGDFRIGMLFNVITLGLISLAMILVARDLRDGRTIFADAFFPLALLNLGNVENLFWSWQISFVFPSVLTFAILLVLVRYPTPIVPIAAVIAGTCLVLLPLCGANGLITAPLISLWLIYSGARNWSFARGCRGNNFGSRVLIGSAILSLCLSALYFVGYKTSGAIPGANFDTILKNAAKFLALGLGPSAGNSWWGSVMFTIGFIASGTVVLVLAILRNRDSERLRAFGILLFLINCIIFALILSWGRAGWIEITGYLSLRYVLLAVPAFCTGFFAWELYGTARLRRVFQYSLLLTVCFLLPFNTLMGLEYLESVRHKMSKFEKDLSLGSPLSILVRRHRSFLLPFRESEELSIRMQMLHDAGIEPFSKMREDSSFNNLNPYIYNQPLNPRIK